MSVLQYYTDSPLPLASAQWTSQTGAIGLNRGVTQCTQSWNIAVFVFNT